LVELNELFERVRINPSGFCNTLMTIDHAKHHVLRNLLCQFHLDHETLLCVFCGPKFIHVYPKLPLNTSSLSEHQKQSCKYLTGLRSLSPLQPAWQAHPFPLLILLRLIPSDTNITPVDHPLLPNPQFLFWSVHHLIATVRDLLGCHHIIETVAEGQRSSDPRSELLVCDRWVSRRGT
jgi:hypothetical protein